MTSHDYMVREAIQLGLACGLQHPYEWYVNYLRAIPQFTPQPDVLPATLAFTVAFAKFLAGAASGPGDQWENLNADGLIKLVDEWYAEHRPGEQI